jgi:hypothetical protein
MTSLTIRLHVQETSRPISGLLVTWYATRKQSLRKELQDPSTWDKVRSRHPSEFGLTRLGSSVTNAGGVARLQLESSSIERLTQAWYTVQTPELAGEAKCSRTIHVACELTSISTDHEQFSVRIPQGILDRSGAEGRSSPVIDGARHLDALHAALEVIKKPPVGPRPSLPNSFASAFNARIAASLAQTPSKTEQALRALSSAAGLQLKYRLGRQTPSIRFDQAAGVLTVRDAANQVDTPLRFGGIRRYTNKGLTEKQIVRPYAEVDQSTGNVVIALPRVPDEMIARESAPSGLFEYVARGGWSDE